MPDLPSITGNAAIKAFSKDGFELDRIRGSHHILKRLGHRFLLSVPVHGQQCVKPGTLRSLIRVSGLTIEQFIELLD